MSHFKEYSKYYDLIYKDKNYLSEVSYIDKIIRKLKKENSCLLDIGCGTGKHASLLVEKGYKVHGIDNSETMLKEAVRNFGGIVSFSKGDIRNFKLDKTFDIITSLFHVMSYQIRNEDLEASFQSVYNHLNPGGYFIFDCWYGPGVMNDLPTIKVKRMKDEQTEIIRIAEPVIHYNESVVDVRFQILINDLKRNQVTKLHEIHSMRYLFRNEIALFAKMTNFSIEQLYSWLKFKSPSEKDWYVFFILKKNA